MDQEQKDELISLIEPIFNKKGKFNGNELKYILQYLNSENEENDRHPWSARLEEKFAERFGANYAICHNSGTSTLHSCLHAAGVGAGDEVIMPTLTVLCCAFSALHQNAVPVYVDTDPDTFNMDPADIEHRITENTKVIMAVHMHGLSCDMDPIMEISRKHNLIVIEDCAQSFLATYKGRLVGTIGDMASFSFETKKHMTTGQGGIVITNNPEMAQSVRKHAGLGYATLSAKQGEGGAAARQFQNPGYKRHDELGYNYRLPEICGAMGLAQLENLDEKVGRRIRIAQHYIEVIEKTGCDWLIPQKVPTDCTNSYWTFAVKYLGGEKYGVPWVEFYDLFNEFGGDGFFGALSAQHNEIVMEEKSFLGAYIPSGVDIYDGKFDHSNASWPNVEVIQPLIAQLKTGYRDEALFSKVIEALEKTINRIQQQ